jgi:hypothetical protein
MNDTNRKEVPVVSPEQAKADLDNHADQLNPNNPTYESSRKGAAPSNDGKGGKGK